MHDNYDKLWERITNTPELSSAPRIADLCDWRNGDEQIDWLLRASDAEILQALAPITD